MKRQIAAHVFSFLMVGFLLAATDASAQTVPYRQTNLASDLSGSGLANHTNPSLRDPWGIAFLPGQPFFTANTNNGRVIVQDATGSPTRPSGFTVTSPASTSPGTPSGMVADPNSLFGGGDFVQPFVIASKDGGLYFWGPDANGDIPAQATLVVDHSRAGAVYTAVAILTPGCCAPLLAAANFHSGMIETYSTDLAQMGSFTDPNLPAGFAPYGMQVLGNQLFVSYAVQDAAGRDPVFGAGNGIVSIFDLQGHFVRRFATAGTLNAPWGITQASADFGPFSNDILIGNAGDGTIGAFDSTGNFAGQLKDAGGNPIVNSGLHALTFRADGFGSPNSLYLTAGINREQDGLFAVISSGAGLATTVILDAPASAALGFAVTLTATVNSAGGIPTGQIVFHDGNTDLGNAPLDDSGAATFRVDTLSGGAHSLTASYAGDEKFAVSTSPPVSITIVSPDFSLSAAPDTATLTAGQSASFSVTVTPAGGFVDSVTFSCAPMAGITCNFNPSTVKPNGGVATTSLTVSTSANLLGRTLGMMGSGLVLAGLFAGTLTSFKKSTSRLQASLRVAEGLLAALTLALALTLASCGGSSAKGQTNGSTVSVPVTAQSASIRHTATVRLSIN